MLNRERDDRFLFTQKKILHGGCLRFPILVSFSWFHLIHWIIYTYRSYAGRRLAVVYISIWGVRPLRGSEHRLTIFVLVEKSEQSSLYDAVVRKGEKSQVVCVCRVGGAFMYIYPSSYIIFQCDPPDRPNNIDKQMPGSEFIRFKKVWALCVIWLVD